MEWNTLLLWSLIVVPVALALCAWAAPGSVRRVLVGVAAVATAGLGVAMGGRFFGWFGSADAFDVLPKLPDSLSSLGFVLELLMIAAILLVAVRIRSWPIIVLAAAQLGLAVTEEVVARSKGVHPPVELIIPFRVDSLSVILVLIVSVIGGQGHIFGRGNHQLSPAVLRLIGLDNILIVASAQKLFDLDNHTLYVDTSDLELDSALSGYRPVIVGWQERIMCKIEY